MATEKKQRLDGTELYINGQWLAPFSNKYFDDVNPATEEVIARIAEAGQTDVDRAVQAARSAFDSTDWPLTTGAHRASVLRKIAQLVKDHKPKLAALETADCGKGLKESEWDVDDVSGCFEYFATQAELLDKRQDKPVNVGSDDFKCVVRYEASGVVGAVIPWNYPLLMLTWKVAPALAAGCTIVLKPSELTPLTAIEFAKITELAGVPPGVFNLITGAGETGALLVNHDGLDKIAFTGSVPTGVRVGMAAIKNIKNVTLELGGKSPVIVFDDVDIPKAVEWVMFGVFWTNGQICSSTSRLLVHEKIADAFVSRLVEETKKLVIADPNLKENAELTGLVGPLVSKTQHSRVQGMVDQAVKEGAQILTGGKRPAHLNTGFFIEPTILRVTPQHSIWRDEVFGPVLSVVNFSTEEEAVRLGNDTEFGLAGAVITKDEARCDRVARRLRCGIVWKNCSQPCFSQMPWGGMKRSGVGRELGETGIDNYLEQKQVTSYVSENPFGWFKTIQHSKL